MRETSKSKKRWPKNGLEYQVLRGNGLDIGPADDPVFQNVRQFDQKEGDANFITKYIDDQFDYVYASHCLEHMYNPKQAILEWWKLVKPGGHLFFVVPDEDLYEQGVFPSRFNPDHKATFTIYKGKSWSPVSINVKDLADSLPNGQTISLKLQNDGFDEDLLTFGPRMRATLLLNWFIDKYFRVIRKWGLKLRSLEKFFLKYRAIDQTSNSDALAQIQCIIKKLK